MIRHTTLKFLGSSSGFSVSTNDLGNFVATVTNPSQSKSFDVIGTASFVTVPNNQWEVSDDNETWSSSLSSITNSTVYVRYAPTLGGSSTPNGAILVDDLEVAVGIPGKNPLVSSNCLAWCLYDLVIEHYDAVSYVDLTGWPSANQANPDYILPTIVAGGGRPKYMVAERRVQLGVGVRQFRGTYNTPVNDFLEEADDVAMLVNSSLIGSIVSGGFIYHLTRSHALRVVQGSAGEYFRFAGKNYSGTPPTGFDLEWFGVNAPRNDVLTVYRGSSKATTYSSIPDSPFTPSIGYVILGDISSSVAQWRAANYLLFREDIDADYDDYTTYISALTDAAEAL